MFSLIQVNKSKAGKIPTFSLGLTPSDEENSDDQNAMKHGKRIEKKPDQKRKEQSATEESDEGSSDHNKAKKHGKKEKRNRFRKGKNNLLQRNLTRDVQMTTKQRSMEKN